MIRSALRKLLPLLVLFPFSFEGIAQDCQCPGDYDYTGSLNPNELVDVIANFQCETVADYCNDLNQDGVFNVFDLFYYLDRLGTACSSEAPAQSPSSFIGIHLVEWTDFPDKLIGNIEGLPPGTKVYRLYASFSEVDEYVVGLYGTESSPMIMNHSATFFGMEYSNGLGPSGNAALFAQFIPEIQLRTYLSLGYTDFGIPDSGQPISPIESFCNDENQFSDFFNSENLSMISNPETCLFRLETNEHDISEEETSNYKFLGQFTTVGSIDGVINIASRYMVSDYQAEPSHFHEGLSFSSENLDVFGCMDSSAFNYDPEATLNADCLYAEPGDLNGDGNFNSGDLTILLANFGCTEDCGPADINGDGVVNSADLIALLGLL